MNRLDFFKRAALGGVALLPAKLTEPEPDGELRHIQTGELYEPLPEPPTAASNGLVIADVGSASHLVIAAGSDEATVIVDERGIFARHRKARR